MARMRFSEAVSRLSTPRSQRKPIPYDPFDGRKFKLVTRRYSGKFQDDGELKKMKDMYRVEFKHTLFQRRDQIPLRYQAITGKASQMPQLWPDFFRSHPIQNPEFWVKARAKWEATPRTHRNNNEHTFLAQLKRQAKATQAPARKPVSKAERNKRKAQRDKDADKKKARQEKAAKMEAAKYAKYDDMKITFQNKANPEQGFAVRDSKGNVLKTFKDYGDAEAWADAKTKTHKLNRATPSNPVQSYINVMQEEHLNDQRAEEEVAPVEPASMIGIAAQPLTREESERVRERIPEKMGRDEAARKVGLDPEADSKMISLFEDVMWGARPEVDIPFGMHTTFGTYVSNRQEAQQPLSGSY